jgi:hypothetical protein
MLKRREFLLGSGGAVAATLVLRRASDAAESPAAVTPVPFNRSLRKENFRRLIDQPVRIRLADGRVVRARVVEVRDGIKAPRVEQFSVFLRGPRGVPLSPGLYAVEHRVAGTTQLFLQPARVDRFSQYYRANFGLLV